MPFQMGNPGGLGNLYSPGNGASTASSAGSSMWNTGESQTDNPYPNGLSIPGTGANGSATVFQDQWDPATNTWAIQQGADGALAPLYTSADWHSANQTKGLGSNESISGGQLTINNKGGGSTQVGYAPDPKTGMIVPVTSQGIGQDSWWQSTGLPIVGAAAAIAGGAYGLSALGAFGGAADAAAGATGVGTDAAASSLGGSVGTSTAGSFGDLSAMYGGGSFGPTAGAASFDPGYGSMISGTANAGTDASAMGYGAAGSAGSSTFGGSSLPSGIGGSSGLGQIFQGAGQLLGGSNGNNGLLGLFNSYNGNQANQNISNNLMGMYNNAGQQAQPAVQQMNQTIQNPNSYFSSPLYQAQASLYGNNVNAGKNAAGTNGNGIDYTQKMMGFAGQNYDNYLSGLTNAANVGLSNQAKYGQDYAVGTALGNTSNAATTANMGQQLLSGGGSMLNGLGSLASGGSSLYNGLSSFF